MRLTGHRPSALVIDLDQRTTRFTVGVFHLVRFLWYLNWLGLLGFAALGDWRNAFSELFGLLLTLAVYRGITHDLIKRLNPDNQPEDAGKRSLDNR